METFCKQFKIEDNQGHKRDKHYQHTGSKNFRIYKNVKKLAAVFQEYDVKFKQSNAQNLYKVLAKNVLPQ